MSTVKPEIAIASHKSPILFDVLLWNPASIITWEDSPDCFFSRWDFCFLSTGKTTGSSSPSNGTAKLQFFFKDPEGVFYYVNLEAWNPSKPGTHDETHPKKRSFMFFTDFIRFPYYGLVEFKIESWIFSVATNSFDGQFTRWIWKIQNIEIHEMLVVSNKSK